MRVSTVHQPKTKIDHELLWTTVGIISLAITLIAIQVLNLNNILPKCIFHHITGYPCISCGSTRSLISLLRFDVKVAFLMNPLACLIYLTWFAYSLYSLVVISFDLPRLRFSFTPREVLIFRITLFLIFVSNWTWLIVSNR